MARNKIEKPRREHQWTTEYLEESKKINTKDIFPIVIPSYQRGINSLTINMVKNHPELNVILYIYKDDYENYREVLENYPHITAVLCEGFRGLAPKRVFINNDMLAKGYKRFFVVDDDISTLYYTIHGKTNSGDYKAAKVQLNPTDFFRMWQYIVTEKAKERIAVCGCIAETGAWAQDLRVMDDIIYLAGQCQMVYIDAELCAEHGVNYRKDAGWEDYDFSLRVIYAGLNSCQIRYLTYSTPAMTPGQSVATTGNYGWTLKSMDLYNHWGELQRFKYMKGQLNSKIRWVSIRAMLKRDGKITINKDEQYMKFIRENDAPGILEYVASKVKK